MKHTTKKIIVYGLVILSLIMLAFLARIKPAHARLSNPVLFYSIITPAETDPVWSAFLLNPIFSNLTSTNFFATNTRFINATTTNFRFTDAIGTNLTVDNLTSTLTASFANDKIHIDNNAATVFALATENALGSYFSTGVLSDFWGVFSDTAYLGSYFDQDGNTAGIPMQIRYGKGNDTGNAILINGAANTLEIPLSTTLLAGLTFTTASGTSITSTNAFFDNLSNTNFSTTNLTSTNLYVSSLANIVKLGVNSSSPVAQLGVKGVAGTNPFAVTSSSDASLFQVNQNGTAGFNTTSQAYALTIQQTDTSKPLLLLQGDSAGLQDLLVLKGFGGQTVSINSAGSYIGPFMADSGLSVALSILSPPNRRLGFNFGSTAGVYWGNTTLYNAAKDVGISRVSSGIIGVGDGTVNGFTGTLAAGKIGIGTSTPANPLVVIGTTTLSGLLDFTIASGTSLTTTNAFFTNLSATTLNLTNLTATSITSTNANFTTLSFTNATGTSVTSTNLYVSSKASIGTTTNTYALNVGGYGRFDRIYTEYASSYFTADTAGIVHTGGNFSNTGGYIYGTGSGVSIYSQNNLSVRGSLLKDNGATLSITGGTSGYTNIATRLGINSSTPSYSLSVSGTMGVTGMTTNITGNGVCRTTAGEITDAGAAACVPSALKYKTNVSLYEKSATELFTELVKVGAVKNYELSGKLGDPRKGLIADMVEKVDPDLVGYSADGTVNTLHFEDITGLSVQAVAELDARVKKLEAQIKILERLKK